MAPPLTLAPSNNAPDNYEETHVHQVYEQIANHFSSTRYKAWPTVSGFLHSIPKGWIGLDAGCGNGKYLPAWDNQEHVDNGRTKGDTWMIGLDRSEGLLNCAVGIGYDNEANAEKKLGKRREVVRGDVIDVGGVRKGCMDFAISIATLHHLSTPERRLQSMQAILRSISPKHGRALVHVWALEQGTDSRRHAPPTSEGTDEAPKVEGDRDAEDGRAQDVFVPWVLTPPPQPKQPKPIKSKIKKPYVPPGSTTSAAPSDTGSLVSGLEQLAVAPIVPAVPEPKVYQRYYHLFRADELEGLVIEAAKEEGITFLKDGQEAKEGAEWIKVVREGWERDNWWCEIERGVN